MGFNLRKHRPLLIAAFLVTLVLFLTVSGGDNSPIGGLNVDMNGNSNGLVKDKSGAIDEQKVKLAEESSHIVVKGEAQLHHGSGEVASNPVVATANKRPHKNVVEQGVVSGGSNLAQVVDSADGSTTIPEKKPSKLDLESELADDDEEEKTTKLGAAAVAGKTSSSSSSNSKSKSKAAAAAAVPVVEDDHDEDVLDSSAKEVTFDPAKAFKEILSLSPVVIFSKSYCPYSKKLKELLRTSYEISPEPAVVELDLHENGKELQNYIGAQSGRKTVPNLFVNGVSRGGSDEAAALHAANELLDKLSAWGGENVKVVKVNAPSNH